LQWFNSLRGSCVRGAWREGFFTGDHEKCVNYGCGNESTRIFGPRRDEVNGGMDEIA